MLNLRNINKKTPAQTGGAVSPSFMPGAPSEWMQQQQPFTPSTYGENQGIQSPSTYGEPSDGASPSLRPLSRDSIAHSTSPGSYSQQLSTWLQNFNPEGDNAPLVTGQTPAEAVGVSHTATWQPGTDVYDWMKAVYGDPEEESRRERANRQRLGIVAVGDALRHLGNIYYTNKYAPAQKLSDATKEESERQVKESVLLQQQRQKAAEMLLRHQKQEADRLYRQQEAERRQQELAMKKADMQDRLDYRKKQGEQIQARIDDLQKRRDLDRQKFEQRKQLDEKNFKLRQRAQAEVERAHKATEAHRAAMRNISMLRLKNAAAKGGGKVGTNKDTSTYLTSGQHFITIPKGKLNSANTRHIFNKVLENADPQEKIRLRKLKTDAERIEAIMQNTHLPGVADDLIALGAEGLANVGDNAPEGVSKSFWQRITEAVGGAAKMMGDFTGEVNELLETGDLDGLDDDNYVDNDWLLDDSLWE